MEIKNFLDADIEKKDVLLRADLDVGKTLDREEKRLKIAAEIIGKITEKSAKLVVIGHRGRPKDHNDSSLSLGEVAEKLQELCGKKIVFVEDITGQKARDAFSNLSDDGILMLENLRFDEKEVKNDVEFAKELSFFGDVYINEAFSVSHRKHASVFALPKLEKYKNSKFAGPNFKKEIESLSKVISNPKKPVLFIISGVKEDKLKYVQKLKERSDEILIGGRLPEYIPEDQRDIPVSMQEKKEVIAKLVQDKEDITIHSIERFEEEIGKAGTIVLSGPIGKFEEDGHSQGTKRVFSAVANSDAFKVAGGGETDEAISKYALESKFDWISSGGGAMLDFLSSGTLPGIEALL